MEISGLGMHATIFPGGALVLLALAILVVVGGWKLFRLVSAG